MALRDEIDPGGLLEFSVVFSDRSLNHMSQRYQGVMRDISGHLRQIYQSDAVALIPGGGTYAMEAVARQLATGERVMVLRNGWFSYRWSQIFEAGRIPAAETVLKAHRVETGPQAPFAPAPLAEVLQRIRDERPAVLFAPHVETSAGMILPDSYLAAVAAELHAVGGLFVLDCVASGAVWVDMRHIGVDVLITAPQKGWSASPSAGIVLLSERARARVKERKSTSFAVDLGRWLAIMERYEEGNHGYHATMPTDALLGLRDAILEAERWGLERLQAAQWALGGEIRALLAQHGLPSVAAEGYEAPGVVVSYTTDPALQSGRAFMQAGLQIAAGVPLMCDEGPDYQSFRVGLFGLDKLCAVDASVARFERALEAAVAPGR